MDKLGKLIFKQLTDDDIPAIEEFCNKCSNLGYENNSSITAMKLHFAVFFAAFDKNKIVSLAGIHKFPEINDRAWRCLFRGAQLPGYTPEWSMNIFKSGIHFSQFLYQQIKYVNNPAAEFYITTNIDNPKAGASSRLHKTMMPRLASQGYLELTAPSINLYNTKQSLWKVNVLNYMTARERWLAVDNCIDQTRADSFQA
jgi:hypothetical protein